MTTEGADATIGHPHTGKTALELTGHTKGIGLKALLLLPDMTLASGSFDGTIRIWNITTGVTTCVLQPPGRRIDIASLALLPDGRLVSGDGDGHIRIWDMHARACSTHLSGHKGRARALLVLPDGRLCSGSDDNSIRVWDVGRCSCDAVLFEHEHSISSLAWLPVQQRLASGSGDRTIRIWAPTAGGQFMCETILAGHTDFINVIAALTDTHLISGSWDGTIRVWDVTHGACLNTMALGAVVWTLAVLPDGRVASGLDGEAEQLCIWNPSAWERVAHVPGHMSAVSALAVSLDGRLVSGDDRGTIIVSLLEPH